VSAQEFLQLILNKIRVRLIAQVVIGLTINTYGLCGLSLLVNLWSKPGNTALMLVFYINVVLIASKEIGLEVNAEKTKYMVMSRDQNGRQNGYIQIGNKSFETVEQFKYL
jgi:hypothetical protein